MSAKWQTGVDGRTLHHRGRMVGAMDSAELADLVVVALNTATSNADILSAIQRLEIKLMGALEDLQAADVALDAEVTALVNEQATFLTDIAAKLASAGVDPAALQAVTDDLHAQAQKLTDLAAAQAAADPGAPPAV